jgi:transposase-like protein
MIGMEEKKKECHKCGATLKPARNGKNRCGSRKCKCLVCGKRYTPEPRKHAYAEEGRQAYKLLVSGMSGMAIGLQMGMSHANV